MPTWVVIIIIINKDLIIYDNPKPNK